MRKVAKNKIILPAYFAQQKELECQFSFLAHIQNAADGRWVHILHLYGYREPRKCFAGRYSEGGRENFQAIVRSNPTLVGC